MRSLMGTNLLVLILLVSSFSGCASKKTSDRYREGDTKGLDIAMSVEDEQKMTAEVLPEMQKQYPAVEDAELQKYVSQLGKKLVAASNLEGHPYHYTFTAVKVDYVNAFALPAGTVFVTLPLINMAENEAELAGVLGHEIGHVMARHTAKRMDLEKKEKSKNIFQIVGGGLLGGAAGYGVGTLVCKKGDTLCMAKATGAGVAVGAAGTLLVQKYKFMANSREDEMEADRIGFRVATKAGYSKESVGTFYEKLLQMEKQNKGQTNALTRALADAMSTHPPSEERVVQMKEMASAMPTQNKPIITTAAFKTEKTRAAGMLKK